METRTKIPVEKSRAREYLCPPILCNRVIRSLCEIIFLTDNIFDHNFLYIFRGSSADGYSRNLLHANYPACFDVNRYKIEIKNYTKYLQFLHIGKFVYIVKLG